MRRVFVLLCVISFALVSCSSSSEGSPEGATISTDATATVTVVDGSTTVVTTSSTTSLPPSTTMLSVTPEFVTIGEVAGFSPASLAFGPDGLPVFVYPTVNQVDGVWTTSMVVATCRDQHCATPPEPNSVWSEPSAEGEVVEVAKTGASFASDGSMLIAFDIFTYWEGIETELDALSQYVLLCADASCTESVLDQIGPLEDPANPMDRFFVILFGAVITDQRQAFLSYETWNPTTLSHEIHLSECSLDAGCNLDPNTDPMLLSMPNDTGFGNGDITTDPDGFPVAAVGLELPGKPSQVLLASCDTTACESPDLSWIAPPSPQGRVDDVRVTIGPSGNPIVAHTRWVAEHMDLYLTLCNDPHCTSHTTQTVATWVRRDWDMAVDADTRPYLAWADYASDEAIIGKCIEPQCSELTTVNTGLVRTEDWLVSMAIAPDGYPMFTLRQMPTGLQLFNCLPEVCNPLVDG